MAWECQRWAGHLSWKVETKDYKSRKMPRGQDRKEEEEKKHLKLENKTREKLSQKIITSSHRSRRKRSKKTAYERRYQMKRRPFLIFPSHFLYPFRVLPPPFSRPPPPPSSLLYFPQSDTCSGGARTNAPTRLLHIPPAQERYARQFPFFFLAPREIEGRRF